MRRTHVGWRNITMIAALVMSVVSVMMVTRKNPFSFAVVSAQQRVFVGSPVTPRRVEIDLRTLPTVRPWQPGDPIVAPRGQTQGPPPPPEIGVTAGLPGTFTLDPLLRPSPAGPASDTDNLSAPIVAFDGIFTGVRPPDTVGDVGPAHYVSARNSQFQIFDKLGNSLAGPSNLNCLFRGP